MTESAALPPTASPAHLAQPYRALLEVSEAIAVHRSLRELFRELARRLPAVVPFDFIGLILHDAAREVMRVHTLEGPTNAGDPDLPTIELPIEDSAGGWVWTTQQPFVVTDLVHETRFPKATRYMLDLGIRGCCMVPLSTAVRRLGAVGFGSLHPREFTSGDLELLKQVGRQVAVAVDNALNHESAERAQRQLERERDRLRLLLEINNAVVSHLNVRELFTAIAKCLREVVPHEYTSLALHDPEQHQLRVYAVEFPGGKGLIREGMANPDEGSPAAVALQTKRPVVYGEAELKTFPSDIVTRLLAEGVKSVCCVPLIARQRVLGTLNTARLTDGRYTAEDVEILEQAAAQVAIAVENALAHREIVELKDKLAKEKLYLEEEIRTEYNFEDIVGDSPALKRVLKQIEIVAPTDSTVLIEGETGTGKELLARAIHTVSGRRERTFVKLNCAAIPTGLLESELFGHEKGAFTGAIAQKLGRFELAHRGTIFLDEVGEIPPELQSKLLRVLQEQEFERLGGTKTIRVDVRLIAATNRDLRQMVADKEFRSDLFYRLNVFPIVVPPLRDRPEDIPILVRYFTQKFARSMNRRIETIPNEAMAALCRYPWPGNVRELENFIERSVILSAGPDLDVPTAELRAPASSGPAIGTLESAEREHILRALKESRWVIGGPSGAAAKLGMKRTTLQSRMQKLGITRPR